MVAFAIKRSICADSRDGKGSQTEARWMKLQHALPHAPYAPYVAASSDEAGKSTSVPPLLTCISDSLWAATLSLEFELSVI